MANARLPEQIWLRVGDAGYYENYDDIPAAAEALNEYGIDGVDGWVRGGFEFGPARGHDYISCYWGDEDADLIRELNEQEKTELAKAL